MLMLPVEMGGGEFGGVARVENLRAGGLQTRDRVERQRIQALCRA